VDEGRERFNCRLTRGGMAPGGALALVPAPPPTPDPFDAAGTFLLSGRVVDPDGATVANAGVYVYHLDVTRNDAGATDSRDQTGRVAETHADGRFQFQFVKASNNLTWGRETAWESSLIAAVALGFGPAWLTAESFAPSGKTTLRLVRDDVPINGRILDLQGRPVPGATIRLLEFVAPIDDDLTPWIKAAVATETDGNELSSFFDFWPCVESAGLKITHTTGPEGRFRVTGIGRERAVKLRIEGPTIETQEFYVLTRNHARILLPVIGKGLAAKDVPKQTYYSATFDHVARPTRPIIGVVRDQETGRPLPGVRIESYSFADSLTHGVNTIQVLTDTEGKYRLVGMPPGSGNIIKAVPLDDQPYLPALKEIDNRAGLEPATADIALTRGIWIRGRVTGPEYGKPIKALIHYYARAENPSLAQMTGFKDADSWLRCRTAADGSFRVVGLPGPGLVGAIAMEGDRYQQMEQVGQSAGKMLFDVYPIHILLSSYHALVEINPASESDEPNCELFVTPASHLNGTVLDPDGNPLAGARVAGLDITRSSWTRANDSATFTVTRSNPGQSRRLLFLHEGRELAGTLALDGDEKEPLSVHLQPAGTIVGRLVDEDGEPLAAIHLKGFVSRALSVSIDALPDTVITDAVGRFRLTGLSPGVDYDAGIDSFMQGVMAFAFKNVSVQTGQTRDLGDVRAQPKVPN
jgi:hypothetical protein